MGYQRSVVWGIREEVSILMKKVDDGLSLVMDMRKGGFLNKGPVSPQPVGRMVWADIRPKYPVWKVKENRALVSPPVIVPAEATPPRCWQVTHKVPTSSPVPQNGPLASANPMARALVPFPILEARAFCVEASTSTGLPSEAPFRDHDPQVVAVSEPDIVVEMEAKYVSVTEVGSSFPALFVDRTSQW